MLTKHLSHGLDHGHIDFALALKIGQQIPAAFGEFLLEVLDILTVFIPKRRRDLLMRKQGLAAAVISITPPEQ
jgi:hypothetical protein